MNNTFIITDVKVDIIYGTAPAEITQAPYIFNVKTSLQFFGDNDSFTYSGSPGYIKGRPLLIGTTKDGSIPAIFEGVQYNLNGFSLKGADNDGKCYYLKKAIYGGIDEEAFSVDDPTIETID